MSTTAKFIKGITGTNDILYDGKFQVAFLGRSNVGKSTLINSLCLAPNLARSSSNPGKTIRMDFFLINDALYFVDFPGYGYAKRSFENRNKLAKMILWYLMYSQVKNRLVLLIIDAKVGFTTQDREMLKTLREEQIDHIIVANKADNLKIGQKEKELEKLQLDAGNAEVILYSSKQRYGNENLLKKIFSHITE